MILLKLFLKYSPRIFNPFRKLILKKLLQSVGKNFSIGDNFIFTHPENTSIGDNVFINENFYCSTVEILKIKDRVMFGANCSIIGGDHLYSDPNTSMRFCHTPGKNKSIVIEEDAWIGHGTIILKNAIISEGSIMGSGSLVNSKTMPYSIYVGNPARFLKPRFKTFDDLILHINYMKKEFGLNSKYSLKELSEIYEK